MAAKSPAAGGSALDRLNLAAKIGIGALLLVLVGVVYFVVFYSDIDSQIASAKQQESNLQGELTKAKTSRDAYQKDLEEKTRREQLAREQKKILPDDSETPAFLSSLQSVATIAGVNLTSWSPMDEAVGEFYAKVPMKLSLTGRFHQVAKFFHGVGQLDRIINIENISAKVIPPADKSSDEYSVSVDCLATAFRAVRASDASKRRGAGR
jgi:type IV pilus assembly protein PilO